MAPYRAHSLVLGGASGLCALGVVGLAGCRVEATTFLPAAGVLALLLGLHFVYATMRPSPVLATLLGTLALTMWSLGVVGILALAGLALGRPLIDPILARADAALGLDARVASEWLTGRGWFTELLVAAYMSSIPLVFATLAGLALARRHDEAWRYGLCIGAAALVCAGFAVVAPAIGAFATLGASEEVLARLPYGGTYHLAVFRAFYEGGARTIDVARLEGVITFPSFHTAMALLTVHAWRALAALRAVGIAYGALVLVSTIPIGGHYFVDVAAGALLCAATIHLTQPRRIAAPPPVAAEA